MLNLPGSLYQMIPLFVLLGTLLMFPGAGADVGTGRWSARRAGPRSAPRPRPVIVAVLVGVLVVMVLNPIVAATEPQFDMRSARYQGAEERTVSVSSEGLWLPAGQHHGTDRDPRRPPPIPTARICSMRPSSTFDAARLLLTRINARQGAAWSTAPGI